MLYISSYVSGHLQVSPTTWRGPCSASTRVPSPAYARSALYELRGMPCVSSRALPGRSGMTVDYLATNVSLSTMRGWSCTTAAASVAAGRIWMPPRRHATRGPLDPSACKSVQNVENVEGLHCYNLIKIVCTTIDSILIIAPRSS